MNKHTDLKETLPNPKRMIEAMGQIGYRFEDAVADLVDNSITAGARNVLVRFYHDGQALTRIAIVDDGHGMTKNRLMEAMRFGSKIVQGTDSLGKYGMGLKLASLSHCNRLEVYTRRSNRVAGARWTVQNIAKGWLCEQLSSDVTRSELSVPYGDCILTTSGTVVLLNDLKGLPTNKKGLKSTITNLDRRLRLHLGLHFHRLLGKCSIFMDQQTEGKRIRNVTSRVSPLDPFGYPESGNLNYPTTLRTPVTETTPSLNLEAHIWPPHSESEEYRLGRRAASRQGFYIYRNNRLIQAGGWNGLVHDDSEVHTSLARVKLEIPRNLDAYFSLNVQKSSVIFPVGFADAITSATSNDNLNWDSYRGAAAQTYRTGVSLEKQNAPFPGSGFSKRFRARFDCSDGHEVRLVKTRRNCEPSIEVDIENNTIKLNIDTLRESKLTQVIAATVFEQLRSDFRKKVLSPRNRKYLLSLNRHLSESF
jgi:hypothetical protein